MKWRTIETVNGTTNIFVNPPTWDEFLNGLEEQRPKQPGASDHCFDKAIKLARDGWPEGRKMLKETKATLESKLIAAGNEPVCNYSESGDEVDVGLYLDNEPEHMIEFALRELKHSKGGKVIRILVNVTSGLYGDTIAPEHFLRGSFALTLGDILEREGYRVEFQVGELGLQSDRNIFIRTTIKQAHEHMDIDRLAFAFGHPSVQMALFFRYYELQEKNLWSIEDHKYGRIGNFNDPDPSVVEIECTPPALQDSGAVLSAHYLAVFTKLGIKLETTTLEPQLQ